MEEPRIVNQLQVVQLDMSCKCNRLSCGGRRFNNIQQLLTHWNTLHHNEDRDCIFLDCKQLFKAGSASRRHFRVKHKQVNKMKLKVRHLSSVPGASNPTVSEGPTTTINDNSTGFIDVFEEDDAAGDIADFVEEDLVTIENSSDTEECEEYYLDYYADFLNRLTNFKFIPASTVQDISVEYLSNALKSLRNREKLLRKSLLEVNTVSPSDIEKIVDDVSKNDIFMKAQTSLNTEYKRTQYIKNRMKYIAPEEIILNKNEVREGSKKDFVHYVPITETIRTLLKDPSMNKMLAKKTLKHTNMDNSRIYDLKDGTVYNQNEYFLSNPEAYSILLYSDAVKIKNPLGAARGTYKVVQVYFTLGEIEKSQRSQIDRLQLVMVFRDKLLKKYSYEDIYRPLVDDLAKLERGIQIHHPYQRTIQCGLLCYAADNLEAHLVGGFSACFSSGDVCRVCHVGYNDLESHIHDFEDGGTHDYWSVVEYNNIVSSLDTLNIQQPPVIEVDPENLFTDSLDVESDNSECDLENEEEVVSARGLKTDCPFNVLSSFHCVNGFPPDILHDIMEGVIPEDLLGILRILSLKEWFTITQYNDTLERLDFLSYERGNKPYPIPTSRTVKKLKGKAVSNLVHLRNWPLLIKNLVVNKDEPVLLLGLKLHELVERMTAVEFYDYEVDILEDLVIDYLDLRKEIRAEYPSLMGRPKPKHHFIRDTALYYDTSF